jgi:hypothetical protein
MEESCIAKTPCCSVSASLFAVNEKAADIVKAYRQQELQAKSWCASLRMQAMSVSFQALVHRPDEVLSGVAGFLRVTEKLPTIRACNDPAPALISNRVPCTGRFHDCTEYIKLRGPSC